MCFIYDNTLTRLYALGYKLWFFSLLDNEKPKTDTDAVVLPGGYPELYADSVIEATKLSVFLQDISVTVYAECGGYIALAQSLSDGSCSWPMFGILKIINCAVSPALAVYKYCVMFGNKRGMLLGHEFHYHAELSGTAENCVYLIRFRDKLNLEGARVGNIFGGYAHCIGLVK
ncbi:Hydrogenobyrinate a,c-diamide synthase [Candidatus Hodgkinia cicadicola]|nr:Hydrogenobyrinate a,c-diamide synthase [Candidatus Hodgkinia cicadicola]